MMIGRRKVNRRRVIDAYYQYQFGPQRKLRRVDMHDTLSFCHDWLAFCYQHADYRKFMSLPLLRQELNHRFGFTNTSINKIVNRIITSTDFAIIGDRVRSLSKIANPNAVNYWVERRTYSTSK